MSPRASESRAAGSSRTRGTTRRRQPGPSGPAGEFAAANGSVATPKSTKRVAGTRSSVRGETPRARGERTRERVAEALISLLGQGQVPPTAKAVAARAGVSVRLVFHHFEDMDALYRKVVALQFERHWLHVREVPADLPLDVRIERTVRERSKLFDEVREVRRAARAAAIRRPDIAARFEESEEHARRWLEKTFAPELSAAGRSRRELLAALDAVASWETWDRMRRSGGLSMTAARRTMSQLLHCLLAG